jgi:hypothetical protein
MNWASNHALAQGDFAAALKLDERVLQVAVIDGDPVLHAIALDGLATILLDQGQLARAEATFEEERTLSIGSVWRGCSVRSCTDWRRLRLEQGQLADAHDLSQQALMLLGQDGNAWIQLLSASSAGSRSNVAISNGRNPSRGALNGRTSSNAHGTIEVLIDTARLTMRAAKGARDRLVLALAVCERSSEALAFIRILCHCGAAGADQT